MSCPEYMGCSSGLVRLFVSVLPVLDAIFNAWRNSGRMTNLTHALVFTRLIFALPLKTLKYELVNKLEQIFAALEPK